MEHLLLAQIQVPPDHREHQDKVFIIDHPCCDVLFGLGVESAAFEMNDEALFNPALWKDSLAVSWLLSDTANRLIASEKPLVLMRYQPDVLRAMGNLAAELWDKFNDVWLFFAFFHSDRDTLVISRTPREPAGGEQRKAALEQKAEWILSLGRFPFVKMVETSIKDVVEFKALQKLFTEYAPER